MANPNKKFWRGKRVLVTGHTGFKGCWLALWLHRLGAEVTGIGLEPNTCPALFSLISLGRMTKSHIQDIREARKVSQIVKRTSPEIIFHLAAQPLVRASYDDPLGTFATNIQGTANLLDSLRGLEKPRVVISVTTDKVYRSEEQRYPYRETDQLGGHDPYSASKAAAELVIASYRDAFLADQGVAVASARAGNVIGGGDWSKDRLIPDAIRAWGRGLPLSIRYPQAIRPWQHVLDPLTGYLRLAEFLWQYPEASGAYNFGPLPHEVATVRGVVEVARAVYGECAVDYVQQENGPHEAGWIALEIAKARDILGFCPQWPIATSIHRTIDWYRRQARGEPAIDLCNQEIDHFESGVSQLNTKAGAMLQ